MWGGGGEERKQEEARGSERERERERDVSILVLLCILRLMCSIACSTQFPYTGRVSPRHDVRVEASSQL